MISLQAVAMKRNSRTRKMLRYAATPPFLRTQLQWHHSPKQPTCLSSVCPCTDASTSTDLESLVLLLLIQTHRRMLTISSKQPAMTDPSVAMQTTAENGVCLS